MSSLGLRLLIVVVVQTLVLLGLIGMRQWTLATGTPVLLETAPIDPRSLFQGDYVRLSYLISTLRLDELTGDDTFRPHDPVYVVLQPGERYWRPVSVHRDRPALAPGQVAIKGTVDYSGDRLWNPQTGAVEEGRALGVRYGIETYFVPEGEGRVLERPSAGRKVEVLVAIDVTGRAGIKAVLVNGEERYRERLF